MQFKIFWRWERPDLKSQESYGNAMANLKSMRVESEKVVEYLTKLSQYGVDNSGNFSVEELLKSPLNNSDHMYMEQILTDKNLAMVIDPSGNSDLLGLLKTNPDQAKSLIEQVVTTEQKRVENIDSSIEDGMGKVDLDDSERLALDSRFNQQVANTDPLTVGSRVAVGTAAVSLFAEKDKIINAFRTGGAKAGFTSLIKPLGGAALAGGVAAAGTAFLKYKQAAPVYDQMVSIYLPMCTKINQTDAFVYKDANMAVAGGMMDLLNGQMKEAASQAVIGLGTKVADTKGLGDAVSAVSGLVFNPRLEKMFERKGIRDFNFTWEFFPRNQEEVSQVKDIIDTFRYHAHPAVSKDSDNASPNEAGDSVKIMLRVPAEFEVRFLSSSSNPDSTGYEENEYIPKIGRCVINNIQVDYTPSGVFSTFNNNAPTSITLTLAISEVSQMTRDNIEKGY
jgi:hypothetical protein